MTSHTLSPRALKLMEDYLHLPLPNKNISCPYYNNKRGLMRAGLRVHIGKGCADEIAEEIKLICIKNKEDIKQLSDEEVKKRLIDNKVGIDCSGLAYHLLEAENVSQNFGNLKKHLKFPYAKNIIRKLICITRPLESTGVVSFAHEKNSREIEMTRAMPGDYIVILYTGREKNYNHIMVIYQTDYDGDKLKAIHYIHSFAWPSDGKYSHGVRKGSIEIIDPLAPIKNQLWTENEKTEKENFTQEKAIEAMYVSIRRLKWF